MIYQYREIGEGEWIRCGEGWYNHCETSTEHDIRIVSKEYLEQEAKKATTKIINNLS